MPISSSATSIEKKRAFRIRGKTAAASVDVSDKDSHKNFLTIGPALPPNLLPQKKLLKRSLSNLSNTSNNQCINIIENGNTNEQTIVSIQNYPDGSIHVSRTQKAKDKNPGRICLDRRGLSLIPIIEGEPQLRLLSLQHNLVSKLEGMQEQNFIYLVFLDIYDNQLERINNLDNLENLRVLLMGKNRLKKIEGLHNLQKLEVLDLHGNLINHISGLSNLRELKVLNLAGNQIKCVNTTDLKGLLNLQELNLRRNRLKKLLGFGDTPQLQKLFISNNEIQTVEDMSSVAKANNLREVTIENNPVSVGGECVSFLVSYLPQLTLLSNMQITDQVRKAAHAWRKNKELNSAMFLDLSSDVTSNIHREEIISNARTNWELIRSQTKCITTQSNNALLFKDLKFNSDFVLTPILCNKSSDKSSIKNIKRVSTANVKMSILPDKKIVRSSSQETENSQNTSSSNNSNTNEFFRLPPILVPILNKMENSGPSLKKWGSLSSIGPNVDSSSFPSDSSDSSDSESDKNESNLKTIPKIHHNNSCNNPNQDSINSIPPTSNIQSSSGSELSNSNKIIEEKISKEKITNDNSSIISGNSTSNIASSSGSELNSDKVVKSSSRNSKRSVRSAVGQKTSHVKVTSRASTAKLKTRDHSPQVEVNKDREQGGDYLIEICGRYLNIYGQGALRFIDKPWNPVKANDVHYIKFNYINFNSLIGSLCKIKNRFPNVDSLIFCETNIYCLGQLNALAEVQGFTSLQINEEGNLIYPKKWRSYAIFRLSHWGLKIINGIEVTEEEIAKANEEYQSLSDMVLWSLPDALLQPLLARLQLDIDAGEISPKKWLCNADPALRSVVSKEALQWRRGSVSQDDLAWRQKAKTHINSLLDSLYLTIEKLRMLESCWPEVLKELLANILTDYSQLDVYMKEKLHKLKP